MGIISSMSTFSHKYSTRIQTGILKRKYLRENYSSNSSNHSSSSSENDSDNESSIDSDDIVAPKYSEKEILAKDKLQYYKFLNKVFPSNYSKSKINKIKRQR